MKRYCASCGSPTEYTIKKPLFCSSCAKPFDKIEEKPTKSVIENIQIKKPTIAKKIYIEEAELDNDINYDDDQDVNEVPNISKLQIETQSDQVVRGVKLKDLMGTSGSENSKKERRKEKVKKVSKKQVLEDFAKEASSLRRSKK
jgi:hypothetical protein